MLHSSYRCPRCEKYFEFDEPDLTVIEAMESDPIDMPDRECPECGYYLHFDEVF